MKKVTDLKENECIHCRTKEEFKAILELNSKNDVDFIVWGLKKDNTVYYPYNREQKGNWNTLNYANEKFNTIHHASDFLEPTYQLTKSQIIAIAENGSLVKELFPDCFDVNGWFKHHNSEVALIYFENGVTKYGLDATGKWNTNISHFKFSTNYYKANEEEITEALINEAKRRGFEGCERLDWEFDGIRFLSSKPELSGFHYQKQNNILTFACGTVFNNGKWAKLIQTPTEVIKIIETYGKDKLIALIEAYERNSK